CYLDSAGVTTYVDSVCRIYPFVERIMLYDISLSNNDDIEYGFSANNLVVYPKGVYQCSTQGGSDGLSMEVHYHRRLPLSLSDDFNNMAVKFDAFIERVDTARTMHEDEFVK